MDFQLGVPRISTKTRQWHWATSIDLSRARASAAFSSSGINSRQAMHLTVSNTVTGYTKQRQHRNSIKTIKISGPNSKYFNYSNYGPGHSSNFPHFPFGGGVRSNKNRICQVPAPGRDKGHQCLLTLSQGLGEGGLPWDFHQWLHLNACLQIIQYLKSLSITLFKKTFNMVWMVCFLKKKRNEWKMIFWIQCIQLSMASVRLTMRSELTWSVSSAMRPGDGRRFDHRQKWNGMEGQ